MAVVGVGVGDLVDVPIERGSPHVEGVDLHDAHLHRPPPHRRVDAAAQAGDHDQDRHAKHH